MIKKTCTYTPFFQEMGKHLEHHLEAEKDWEVKVGIYIDGPYPLFDHKGESKSTDGSRELIASYDHTIILDMGFNYMPKKNNLAMHEACKRGYESVLVTGCDEWIEGKINELDVPEDVPLCRIPLIEHNPTGKYNRWETDNPRLITMPAFVRSVDVHWFWFYCNKLITAENYPLIEGLTIHSDDNMRPDKRDKMMTEYQELNVPRERGLVRDKYMQQILNAVYPPTISASGNMYYTCGCINRPDGVRLKKCVKHEDKSAEL